MSSIPVSADSIRASIPIIDSGDRFAGDTAELPRRVADPAWTGGDVLYWSIFLQTFGMTTFGERGFMFWLWLLFQGWRDDERERYEEGKLFSTMTLAERKAHVDAQKAAQEKALESDWTTLFIAVGAIAGFIVLACILGIMPGLK